MPKGDDTPFNLLVVLSFQETLIGQSGIDPGLPDRLVFIDPLGNCFFKIDPFDINHLHQCDLAVIGDLGHLSALEPKTFQRFLHESSTFPGESVIRCFTLYPVHTF